MPRWKSVLAFAGVAVLIGLAVLTLPGTPGPNPAGPITTARAILSLSPSEAEERRPVYLPEAVVTAFDPEMHVTFVQDATGGVYIDTFKTPVGEGRRSRSGQRRDGPWSPRANYRECHR